MPQANPSTDTHHAIFRIAGRTIFCRCGWTGKVIDLSGMWDLYLSHVDTA